MKSKFNMGPEVYVPNLWSMIIMKIEMVRKPYKELRALLEPSALDRSKKFTLAENDRNRRWCNKSGIVASSNIENYNSMKVCTSRCTVILNKFKTQSIYTSYTNCKFFTYFVHISKTTFWKNAINLILLI